MKEINDGARWMKEINDGARWIKKIDNGRRKLMMGEMDEGNR